MKDVSDANGDGARWFQLYVMKDRKQTIEVIRLAEKHGYSGIVITVDAPVMGSRERDFQVQFRVPDGIKYENLEYTVNHQSEAKEDLKEAKQAVRDVVSVPEQPTSIAVDPNLQSWLDKNAWFGEDRRMTSIANGIGEGLRLEFPGLKGEAFLEKLDEALAEEFPNRFGGKSKSPSTNRVESGSGRQSRSSSNAQSYENLPSEAKAACDRFVKQKLMTREQYVADFDWN
jgi:hypothetical protein